VRPLRDAVLELASDLEPVARELGCADELGKVEELLRVGASYQRQRAVAAAHDDDLRAVVDALITEMDDGVL
jgi:carboxylate-amine ligase